MGLLGAARARELACFGLDASLAFCGVWACHLIAHGSARTWAHVDKSSLQCAEGHAQEGGEVGCYIDHDRGFLLGHVRDLTMGRSERERDPPPFTGEARRLRRRLRARL